MIHETMTNVINMGKGGIVAIMLVTAGTALSEPSEATEGPRTYTNEQMVTGLPTGPVWTQQEALDACDVQPTAITTMTCRQAALDTDWN